MRSSLAQMDDMVEEAIASEEWDWVSLFYAGTTILGLSEESFWKATPRKLNALTKIHMELNSQEETQKTKKAEQTGFIDQLW